MLIEIAIVIGVALVMQIVGFVWYGPLFGKAYAKVVGLPAASEMSKGENKAWMKKMIPTYVTSFVLNILTVWVLIGFVGSAVVYTPAVLLLTVLIWLGFVMPVVAAGAMWSGKPRPLAWKMFWITAGYQFAAFVIGALLIAWWL